ncbi:MAG: response regulator [Geobacteraceae bacterium]|nr:response regulator [Geobacteraceae bacterium]
MKKVLLVSSSVAFLGRNAGLLSDKGFEFFTAKSGAEAIRLHQKQPFDLVISDLELEGMDGRDLCLELRKHEQSKSLPFVLICYDSPAHIEKVRESKAAAILIRPINPTHLLVTIGSLINMQLARSKRVAFNSEVLTKKQDLEFVSQSHDISATGILLETEHLLSQGDTILCDLKFDEALGTEAQGEVIRCLNSKSGKKLYGVKFVELPPPKRNMIERYVASNTHLGISQKPIIPLGNNLE